MARRVVITGLGAVTPFGIGITAVWDGIIANRCAIGTIDYPGIPCRVAGRVPPELDASRWSPAECRQLSRAVRLALIAADEAIVDSRIDFARVNCDRIGVAVGMGMADLDDIFETGRLLADNRYSRISPYFVPRILTNMAAGQISIRHRLRGPNHAVSTACTTGLHSIGDAAEFIRRGAADAMLAGLYINQASEFAIF